MMNCKLFISYFVVQTTGKGPRTGAIASGASECPESLFFLALGIIARCSGWRFRNRGENYIQWT